MIDSKDNALHHQAVADKARSHRRFKNKIKLMIALSIFSIIRKTVYVMTVVTLPFSLLLPRPIGLARSNETVVFSDAAPGAESERNAEVINVS